MDQVVELVRKLRVLEFDVNEYLCLKFVILLNPGKTNYWYLKLTKQNNEGNNSVKEENAQKATKVTNGDTY